MKINIMVWGKESNGVKAYLDSNTHYRKQFLMYILTLQSDFKRAFYPLSFYVDYQNINMNFNYIRLA